MLSLLPRQSGNRRISQSASIHAAFALRLKAQPLGLLTFEATSAFTFVVGIELGRADVKVKGYQSHPFGCEMGSQFHQHYVSRGPPIIPDGRVSQVRFGILAFLHGSFQLSEV